MMSNFGVGRFMKIGYYLWALDQGYIGYLDRWVSKNGGNRIAYVDGP